MLVEYSGRFCSSLPSAEPVMGAAGRTGSWRVYRPIIDKTRCTRCLLCWLYCPEGCIERTVEDDVEVRLEYCKGCGICAEECPLKAITMVREGA